MWLEADDGIVFVLLSHFWYFLKMEGDQGKVLTMEILWENFLTCNLITAEMITSAFVSKCQDSIKHLLEAL